MSSSQRTTADDDTMDTLEQSLRDLRRRFTHILDRQEREDLLPGLTKIAEGLQDFTTALRASSRFQDQGLRTRLDVIAQGAIGILSILEDEQLLLQHSEAIEDAPEQPAAPVRPPSPSNNFGLAQFISAFRNEARKRLAGLSISMMTLFHEQTSERALEDSAHHLHAIKGGAAMLSLTEIAAVSGLMEQVLVTMRKLPPPERTWPTKTLMRGFRLLQDAVADEDAFLSPELAAPVKEELSLCFESLLQNTTLEELSRPMISEVEEVAQEQAPALGAPPEVSPTQHLSEISAPPSIEPTHQLKEISEPHELDLIEAARRAELDQPTEYDETFAQTASLDGMEQRLLIVDDVEMIAASIGFVLSELELPMDIANNGQEALKMLRERPYSLVISDIAMPHMDGLTLTERLRRDPFLSDIPLILLTSLDHPREREAGLRAGANDYIIKGSIGGGELVHRVRELLKIAPFVPSDAPPRPPRWKILVAEDAETVAASIAFLLSEGDYDITIAGNGHEALTRLEREDFDLLLSDWQMPNMSGYELTQAIRASAHIRQIPIVLLTSLDSDKVKEDARKAGANAFLVKGEIGGGALLQVIGELLPDAP